MNATSDCTKIHEIEIKTTQKKNYDNEENYNVFLEKLIMQYYSAYFVI